MSALYFAPNNHNLSKEEVQNLLKNKHTMSNEVDEAIDNLEICLNEAPVDFLGTGSDSKAADKDFDEWKEIYTKALKVLREWQSRQLHTDTVGEDELEKLAKSEYPHNCEDTQCQSCSTEKGLKLAFKKGYKAAQKTNTKSYTIEDIEKAFDAGHKRCFWEQNIVSIKELKPPNKTKYIQSLKQGIMIITPDMPDYIIEEFKRLEALKESVKIYYAQREKQNKLISELKSTTVILPK